VCSFECVRKEGVVTEFKLKSNEKEDGAVLSEQAKIVAGWRCELQPVVSADRRSVRLSVNVEHFTKDEATSIESSTKAAKIFNLPDGNTLVWTSARRRGGRIFCFGDAASSRAARGCDEHLQGIAADTGAFAVTTHPY